MIFFPRRIVSFIDSVNSGLWSLLVLSTWESVHLGGCLLVISSLGSLATWHSSHVRLFPLLFLSTLDCAKFWFFLLRSPSTWDFIYFDSVHSQESPHDELLPKECPHRWFSLIWILLTFASVYLGVGPPGCLSTWKVYTLVSGQMTFCPRRIVSTIGSVNSGFCSRLDLSSWESVQVDVYLLGFCQLENCAHDILPIEDCVKDWFCQLWIVLTFGSVYLVVSPRGWLSTWNHFTWESGHMTFCPRRIVSTIDSVNYGFCPRVVLSACESVQLGVCLPGFCPRWSLVTWHSLQMGLCPILVLSTLDFAHVWYCLLGILSNWVFAYMDSFH